MIDLRDKTMSSILNSMLLRIDEEVNKRDGSFIRTALSVAAWAIEGIYIDLLDVQNQAYGTTATGEYLDLKVAERGLTRHPATNEICYMLCNLSNLELDFQFGDSSGYTWNVVSEALSGPDEEGLYRYEIACQTYGDIAEPTGNLHSLSFLAGLMTAKFDGVISPGQNVEGDDNLRKRYEESLVEIAFAGNVAAYREKMLALRYEIGSATATIGALQVYSATDAIGNVAGGHVKIYIVDSEYGVASEQLIESVQEAICPMYNGEAVGLGNGFAPIGAAVHIASATTTPTLEIDIVVTLRGETLTTVKPKIVNNVMEYIRREMAAWGTQVKLPTDTARISIKKAFLYSAALVSGVSDVTSLVIKKDGVSQTGIDYVTWDTNRESMEWIDLDDVVISVTT